MANSRFNSPHRAAAANHEAAESLIIVKGNYSVRLHDAPMTHTISSMQHHHAMVHLERLENMLADLLRLISDQRGGGRTHSAADDLTQLK